MLLIFVLIGTENFIRNMGTEILIIILPVVQESPETPLMVIKSNKSINWIIIYKTKTKFVFLSWIVRKFPRLTLIQNMSTFISLAEDQRPNLLKMIPQGESTFLHISCCKWFLIGTNELTWVYRQSPDVLYLFPLIKILIIKSIQNFVKVCSWWRFFISKSTYKS